MLKSDWTWHLVLSPMILLTGLIRYSDFRSKSPVIIPILVSAKSLFDGVSIDLMDGHLQ